MVGDPVFMAKNMTYGMQGPDLFLKGQILEDMH